MPGKDWEWRNGPLLDHQILGVMADGGRGLFRGCARAHKTRFGNIDIDQESKYHNPDELHELARKLAAVKLRAVPYQSSDSGGWHLYLFLDDWEESDEVGKTLKAWLKALGYELKGGVLEVFPSGNALRLPLQPGFAWLDDNGEVVLRREDLGQDEAIRRFLFDLKSKAICAALFAGTLPCVARDGLVDLVTFSPDSKTLASCDDNIRLWDVTSGNQLPGSFLGKDFFHLRDAPAFTSVTFSPEGRLLASTWSDDEYDHAIKLWDVASGKMLRTLSGRASSIGSLAFGPNNKILAIAGGQCKTIGLRDVASGKELHTLAGHTSSIESLAFSPDGKTLASGSDKTIKLWNVGTGKDLLTVASGWVHSLAFSPDGKTLASGSHDNIVRLWSVVSDKATTRLSLKFLRFLKFRPLPTCTVRQRLNH